MIRSKRSRVAFATLAVLALLVAAFPRPAAADGRIGARHGRTVIIRGFYGWPHYGFGWGPYFSPFYDPYYGPYRGYAYRPAGGIDMNVAVIAGLGAVDLNVKPGEAEVWVDGKFVAEARDLDGYPSYLWLPEGGHRVVVYRPGYLRFDEQIDVRRGVVAPLKLRLEKGESVPPGERPGKSTSY